MFEKNSEWMCAYMKVCIHLHTCMFMHMSVLVFSLTFFGDITKWHVCRNVCLYTEIYTSMHISKCLMSVWIKMWIHDGYIHLSIFQNCLQSHWKSYAVKDNCIILHIYLRTIGTFSFAVFISPYVRENEKG